MQGQVYKIHSDFYYVKGDYSDNGTRIIECKLREVLKKQNQKVFVGDFVEVDETGAIFSVRERKNFITRPSAANIDLAVIVSSLLEPKLDYVQLNRYLTFLKYNNIDTILCFNKEDLLASPKFSQEAQKIISTYTPLGYKILFTSAKEKHGLDDFKAEIKGKTIVLCGLSGVGKSSIINALNPDFDLRIGSVSAHSGRGTHTTRHSEILDFGEFRIIDTPGFSNLKFDFILPKDLDNLFEDILFYARDCKYSDCLHLLGEEHSLECNVIKNIDKINEDRYKSYLEFLSETREYKEKVTYQGTKEEEAKKHTFGKNKAKISRVKRESSRNTTRQKMKNLHEIIEEDNEY